MLCEFLSNLFPINELCTLLLKGNDQSSYQNAENKERPSDRQQQEHLSLKAKEKTVEASKPIGNVMKETCKEPKKSGERQVYVSTNIIFIYMGMGNIYIYLLHFID